MSSDSVDYGGLIETCPMMVWIMGGLIETFLVMVWTVGA